MAVVAGLHFSDRPAGSASFCGKRRKERPRRISFRNAGNERGRNAGLAIGRKRKRLFKTAETEITQPRAHKITGLTRLQSPEIKLALPARQPPAVSMLSRDVAKMGANLRRKQVQHALPIFRNEGIQKNQSLDPSWLYLCHTTDDHARVTVTDKDHGAREP